MSEQVSSQPPDHEPEAQRAADEAPADHPADDSKAEAGEAEPEPSTVSETTEATSPRRVRLSQRCAREVCNRRKADGKTCCSWLCRIISDRINDADELCRRIASPTPSREFCL